MYYLYIRMSILVVLVIVYIILLKSKLKTKKSKIRIAAIMLLIYVILQTIPVEKNILKFDNYIDCFSYYKVYQKIEEKIEYDNCAIIMYETLDSYTSFFPIGKENNKWSTSEIEDKSIFFTNRTYNIIVIEFKNQNKIFISIGNIEFLEHEDKYKIDVSDSLKSEFTEIQRYKENTKNTDYYTFISLNEKTEDYFLIINQEKVFIK